MNLNHALTAFLLFLLSPAASAHAGLHPFDGWTSGFLHPFQGGDHLLAMLAVGLWAALNSPGLLRIWQGPFVFMGAMLPGGALGAMGFHLPGAEVGTLASVAMLGFLIAGAAFLPKRPSLVLIGVFALFHGHSHGVEMAQGAEFWEYALGFVMATGLLHLAGVLTGCLMRAAWIVRASGAAIGGIGLFWLCQAV